MGSIEFKIVLYFFLTNTVLVFGIPIIQNRILFFSDKYGATVWGPLNSKSDFILFLTKFGATVWGPLNTKSDF